MKFAQLLFIVQLTLYMNKAYGQEEEFKRVPDSEIVHLSLSFAGGGFGIQIVNLPDDIMGCGLAIQNLNGTCSGGKKIEGRQFFIEINGSYSKSDTFVMYLFSLYDRKLYYPAEVFTLSYIISNKVKLGADLCILNCVPDHDPWMPTADDPFLFPKNGYYINPKNGKIKKGARLINSGNYSICDLKEWKYISPYGIYLDNHRNRFRGSELIARGKIELADWNLKEFDLYWFR
ncbi:MAG: hypothetical protein MH137_02860 [Flavobacteriales bacterium]|nr:hypothetical protein [Flavobacteriales bacterium]